MVSLAIQGCEFLERVCPRKHLFLHIDINKTIIQTDGAGGRSFEDVLNSNVAANVYGYVNSSTGNWKPLYGPEETISKGNMYPNAITYDTYVDQLYPEPDGMQLLSLKERKELWKRITDQRKQAVKHFTHVGSIGEQYSYLVEEQRRRMTIDQSTQKLHSILPSFFNMINSLSEAHWEFSVIFRTFGDDLDKVISEWRDFVGGNHICKPKGRILKEMRGKLKESIKTGCIYRSNEKIFFCKGPSSIRNTICRIDSLGQQKKDLSAEDLRQHFELLPGFLDLEEVSFSNLRSKLAEYFLGKDSCVGGLVDHYEHWASVAERRSGGKIFPVPIFSTKTVKKKDDSANFGYSVFFDDNIYLGEDRSIVDIRDECSGLSVCDAEVEKKFCVSVNPLKAIIDDNYFIKELAQCLRLQVEN